MPSGNGHSKLNLLIAMTGGAMTGFAVSAECGAILAGAAIVSDAFLSPDLDQSFSNARRRWWILKGIWQCYSRLDHRSPLSHWPVLSDALRLGYLAAIAGAALFVTGSFWMGAQRSLINVFSVAEVVELWIRSHPEQSLAAFGGLSLATAQHAISDWAVSEAKGAIKDWTPKKRKRKR